MPYHVGGKGTSGCDGFPVVDDKGKVMGCHPTKDHANKQVQALYSAGAAEKVLTLLAEELKKEYPNPAPQMINTDIPNPGYQDCGCATCKQLNCDCEHCPDCQAEDNAEDAVEPNDSVVMSMNGPKVNKSLWNGQFDPRGKN